MIRAAYIVMGSLSVIGFTRDPCCFVVFMVVTIDYDLQAVKA